MIGHINVIPVQVRVKRGGCSKVPGRKAIGAGAPSHKRFYGIRIVIIPFKTMNLTRFCHKTPAINQKLRVILLHVPAISGKWPLCLPQIDIIPVEGIVPW